MRPLHDEDPAHLGPYRLVGCLGEGTTARTYLGAAPDGGPVVVRSIRDDLARDPHFRDRFGREVDAARRLPGPGTAIVVDADISGSVLWYATTHVPGPGLDETVRRFGPLPGHSLRVLAGELARSLGQLHALGLHHGRLDPAAVTMGLDGPRLPGLGIAHAPSGSSVTPDGVVLGTVLDSPGFRSPEQVRDLAVGPETDVFSLGALLVFAATGSGPFDGPGTGSIADRVTDGEPDLSDAPASLRNLLAACLIKDPARRPGFDEIVRSAAGSPGSDWLPVAASTWVAERVANPWEPPRPMPGSAPYAATTVPEPPSGTASADAASGTDDDAAPAADPGVSTAGAAGNGDGGESPVAPTPVPDSRADAGPKSGAGDDAEPAAASSVAARGASDDASEAGSTAVAEPAVVAGAGSRASSRRGFVAAAVGAAVIAGGAAVWATTRGGGGGKATPAAQPSTAPPQAPPPSPAATPSTPAAVQELAVWTTEGLVPPALLGDLGLEYGKGASGVRLGSRVQGRADYTRKLESALRAGTGPDVFEVDLLSLARFRKAGLIMDLTPHLDRFDASTWFPAVRSTCTSDGRLMALPLSASAPVVLYDKGLFQAAQVGVPNSRVAWVADLEKLRSANPDNSRFRALYVPGGAWPVLASCVWEDGGTIAVEEGEAWRGTLDLPGSIEGARFFRHLQSYAPDAAAVGADDAAVAARIARGGVASVVGDATLYEAVIAARPGLRAVLGAFSIPGRTAGSPAAVGVRGTALAVSSKTMFAENAIGLLALIATERWRSRIAADGGLIPVGGGISRAVPPNNPMISATLAALPAAGRSYPVAPGWSERPLAEMTRQALSGVDLLQGATAANGIVAREFGVVRA